MSYEEVMDSVWNADMLRDYVPDVVAGEELVHVPEHTGHVLVEVEDAVNLCK